MDNSISAFKRRRNALVALGLVLVILLGILLVPKMLIKSSAESESEKSLQEINDELRDVRNQLSQLSNKQDTLSAKIKELKNKKSESLAQKDLIEQEILSIEEQIELMNVYISNLTDSISLLNDKISKTQAEYNETYELYKSRIRANYENGNLSFLEILLTARSLSELLTRFDFAAYVIKYDQTVLDNTLIALNSLDESKNELQNKLKESLEMNESLVGKVDELKAAEEELSIQLEQLLNDESYLYEQRQKYSQMEMELDKQVAQLMDMQKAYAGGYLLWPVEGYTYISSYFGYRTLYGSRDFHNAIDIPAPKGTEIHAANSGTVILAEYVNTGGGNKIVIDHGGGVLTIYCHCSKILCKKGDIVNVGDVIGLVGMTGTATGNHLHFGIYKDKEYLDPMLYVNPENDISKIKTLF